MNKLIRDRKELENNLLEAIERIKYKNKNVAQVNKSLSEFGIPSGFFNEIINKKSLLSEIDLGLLCLITDAVFKIDGSDSVRTASYFTEGEINSSESYKFKNDQGVELPIVLKDVLKIDQDRFITTIKMTELVKWYHSGLIVYDSEVQRGLKYIRNKDGVVPVPIVNRESVDDIAEDMEEETFFTDTIRINVYAEDFEPIVYNPKTKILTIKEDVVISIVDGFHRLKGAIKAVLKNPEMSLIEELSICMYDTDTAKKFFGQINKQNPIDKQRLEELEEEKVSFAAVKQLKLHSDLKGKIASGSKVSKIADQWTTESTLANAIEYTFEPKNTPQANAIGQYLTEYFNHLVSYYKEEFNVSSASILKHQRMFIGYVVFAKKLKDLNLDFNHLSKIIDNLNVNNNNELIDIVTDNRGTSSRLQKKVREYFENINIEDILKMGV
jgi:hypothetical protein